MLGVRLSVRKKSLLQEVSLIDADLLDRYAAKRDAEAFALLVSRYHKLIFATCRRQLHDAADVEDAAQETFLRLAKSAGTIRTNLGGWLHRSALRVCTDLNRRRKTRSKYETSSVVSGVTSSDMQDLIDMREHLDLAIQKLNPKEQELIVQRFFVGRQQAELAAEAGVAPSTMSQRLERAIGHLRQHLAAAGCVVAATAIAAGLEKEAASAAVPTELPEKLTAIGLSGLPPIVSSTIPAILSVLARILGVVAVLVAAIAIAWALGKSPKRSTAAGPATEPATGTAVGLTVNSNDGPLKAAPQWKQTPDAIATSPLSGHVLDRQGKPIAGAVVSLSGSSNASATTDAQGRYAFDSAKLSDGKCQLGVMLMGYQSVDGLNGGSPELLVSAQTRTIRDFVLDRGVEVTVAVHDAQRKPLPNAGVYLYRENEHLRQWSRILTDAQGAVGFTLPPSHSPWTVMVSLDGYAPAHQQIIAESIDQPIHAGITLPKGISITGIAFCNDGKPANRWSISAAPTWFNHYLSVPDSVIRPDGRFTLEHVSPGDYHIAVLNRQAESSPYVSVGTFTFPKSSLRLDIPAPSIDSLPALTGKVVLDNQMQYDLFVTVTSDSPDFAPRLQMLKQNGYLRRGDARKGIPFKIADLPAGIYQLHFHGEEVESTVLNGIKVPCEPLVVKLKVIGNPHLLGRVLDPSGQPVEHFAVRILQDSNGGYAQDARWLQISDPEGRFDFELARTGTYQAQVSADGYVWSRSEPTAVAQHGERAETVVHLTTGGGIRGSVVDLSGHPIAGAKVIPLSMAQSPVGAPTRFFGEGGAVLTDIAGNFVIDHLAVGPETLKIFSANFTALVVPNLTIAQGNITDAGKLAMAVGGSVDGIAYDELGRPMAGELIEVQDDQHYHFFEDEHAAQLIASALTDSSGHFRFDHLPSQNVYVVKSYMSSNPTGLLRRMTHPTDGQATRLDLGGTQAVHGRLIANGKPVAGVGLTFSIGDPSSGETIISGLTGSDGRFTFFGPPPGLYTLSRDVASPYRRLAIADLTITPTTNDIGDVVQDTNSLSIEVKANDPEELANIDEIDIERTDSDHWWARNITAAKRDTSEPSIWRAADVPAAPLRLVVWMKGENPRRKYFVTPNRKPGAAPAPLQIRLPAADAAMSFHLKIDKGSMQILRSDDGANEISVYEDAPSPCVVGVPPGNYFFIDRQTDKPRPDIASIHAVARQTTAVSN
jgi:RNA polymerase sigma factor (sigma-70 family)